MKRVPGITRDELKCQFGEAPSTQGVPEDHELTNGFVYDVNDLQQVGEANHQQRQPETAWAEGIACEEEKATRSVALRELSPTIIALGQRLEQIRSAVLERYRSKLDTLKPAQREAVEDLTRVLLNKFLHGPVRELKARAGAPGQHALAQLLGRIFGLGQQYGLVLQRQKGEYVFPEN